LVLVSTLVNDRLQQAFPIMKRARKIEGDNDSEIIEPHRIAITVIDFKRKEAGTVTGGGFAHRNARAYHVATAVFDVSSFNGPVPAGDRPRLSGYSAPRELSFARFRTDTRSLEPLRSFRHFPCRDHGWSHTLDHPTGEAQAPTNYCPNKPLPFPIV